MDKARFISTLPEVGDVVRVCAPPEDRSNTYFVVFEAMVVNRVSTIDPRYDTRDQDGRFIARIVFLTLEHAPIELCKTIQFNPDTGYWTTADPNIEISVEKVVK